MIYWKTWRYIANTRISVDVSMQNLHVQSSVRTASGHSCWSHRITSKETEIAWELGTETPRQMQIRIPVWFITAFSGDWSQDPQQINNHADVLKILIFFQVKNVQNRVYLNAMMAACVYSSSASAIRARASCISKMASLESQPWLLQLSFTARQ